MKRSGHLAAVFVIALVTVSTMFAFAWAENGGRPDLILAHSGAVLAEVDTKDATAAMKVWVAKLAKDLGYTAESYITPQPERIVEDLENGDVDVVAVTSLEFLRFVKGANVELIMSHVRRGQPTQKYLLVTKTGSGLNNIGDLRQKRIAVLKNDQISLLFLNTLLLRQNLAEAPTFFSAVQEKLKSSQIILSVFFGQADACITTESSLSTVMELNPQVQKALHIVASSPPVMDSIMVARKDYSEDLKRKLIEKCRDLKNTPRGKQILLLFKIDDLIPANESSLDSLKQLVAEYDRLKTRQNKHVARGG